MTIKEYLESPQFDAHIQEVTKRHKRVQNMKEIKELVARASLGEVRFSRLGLELDKILGGDPDDNLDLLLDLKYLLRGVSRELHEEQSKENEISSSVTKNKELLDSLTKEIIREAKLKISDDVLLRRFQNVAFSWFRDVRDDFETKTTAMRETRVGGLGFSEQQADSFISLLKRKENEYKEQGVMLAQLVNKY